MGNKDFDNKKNTPSQSLFDNLDKHSRIKMTIHPQSGGGFNIIDQDSDIGLTYAMESTESIEKLIKDLSTSLAVKVLELIGTTANNDYVEFTFVVGSKPKEDPVDYRIDFPQTYSIDMVASLFNKLNVARSYSPMGFAPMAEVTKEDLIRLMLASGMATKVAEPRIVEQRGGKGGGGNRPPNEFRDKGNSGQQNQNKNTSKAEDTSHEIKKEPGEDTSETHTIT